MKLVDNMPKDDFRLIGQWQNGFFAGVAPQRAGVGRGGGAEAGLEVAGIARRRPPGS